jgi:hypothetical protein
MARKMIGSSQTAAFKGRNLDEKDDEDKIKQ